MSATKPPIHPEEGGFSLPEFAVAMTLTLVVLGMAFFLVASSLNRKSREETQAEALADANQALGVLVREVSNAGFGLRNNGIVAADSNEGQIRVRANLNALMKQTTSNSVTDPDEDLIFRLVPNPNGGSSLVRVDVARSQSDIIATEIDDTDVNSDGDGLTFNYLDAAGDETSPETAVRVGIAIRTVLPQVGRPGSSGFQPRVTKELSASVVLRNARTISY